ncbi:AAA family ATPase [uncultured Amphritea sp.]|uniref:AAA family ATPase n=1 Tax=uncultured Amphritea sp. TaxID=981605 RepID=UPI0026178363|nr:AAA family ATPase [uncultured Amphritea sp.]
MISKNKLYMIVGVPGSGKTTLTRKLAQQDLHSHCLSCSELLREIMQEQGIDSWSMFDALDKTARFQLVNLVTRKLEHLKTQHRAIYADAHMLVKNRATGTFEVGLTQSDADILDGLIFLDTQPVIVQENTHRDNELSTRKRPNASLMQIESHRKQELEAAQQYCEQHGISLYVINNSDNDYSITEVLERISNGNNLAPATENSLHNQLSTHLERIGAQGGPALVLDGDRTFSEADAFRFVDSKLGLRTLNRQVFESFGYHLQSYIGVSENWKSISIFEYVDALGKVAEEIQPRSEWLEVLSKTPKEIPVFLVTAGIPQLWQYVLSKHQLNHIKVIGGTHPYLDKELITQDSKSEIINLLKKRGYWVMAAGDSPIDAPMLNDADVAIVVPDSKGSLPLINRLDHKKGWFYLAIEGYREKSNAVSPVSIHSTISSKAKFTKYRYLNHVDGTEIASAHSRSKVAGTHRLGLKTEHKKIGALFLSELSTSNPDVSVSNTVVIGVERSGRYLAEGAADMFDCPLLSAYEVSSIHTEKENEYDTKMIIPHLHPDIENIVIYDSVIHTGGTIQKALSGVPKTHQARVFIFCTEVNEASLEVIKSLSQRAEFYCLRISSRKEKPSGNSDMGAKLYGTLS